MAPTRMKDPMPYGVACLLGTRLLEKNLVMAATALAWMFDTYCRPEEAVSAVRENLLAPTPAAGAHFRDRWVFLVGGQDLGKPTKTKNVDGSIEVGHKTRSFMRAVAAHLHRLRAPGDLLFGLTYLELAGQLRQACHDLVLDALRLSPHSARHGGASEDFFRQIRSLAEIKKRGQWESAASVARYEKSGKLVRQMNLLPLATQQLCRSAEDNFPLLLLQELRRL